MTIYAHLIPEGGMFGFDTRTPLTWELSSRPRPKAQYSYRLNDCPATAKFFWSKSLTFRCTFAELEPFIAKETLL